MNGYEGPLDLPLIGDFVAQAVQQFAEFRSLKCDLWYHDEPLWIVWQESQPDFFREVQVAAFHTEQGEQLLFIPQAYKYIEDKTVTTSPEDQSIEIIQTPLLTLYRFREDTDIDEERHRIKNIIDQNLGNAWEIALELSEERLIYTVGE